MNEEPNQTLLQEVEEARLAFAEAEADLARAEKRPPRTLLSPKLQRPDGYRTADQNEELRRELRELHRSLADTRIELSIVQSREQAAIERSRPDRNLLGVLLPLLLVGGISYAAFASTGLTLASLLMTLFGVLLFRLLRAGDSDPPIAGGGSSQQLPRDV
jgi:hypothetical protein